MKNATFYVFGLVLLAFVIVSNCVYVVRQIDRAVLLTFGEVTNPDVSAGLHFKIPLAQNVRIFDGRIQTLDAPTQSYLTSEREYLEVDSYAKWKIADTATFYRRTGGDDSAANNLLAQRINTGLRNQFASRTVHEAVSGERDLLMTDLTESLNAIVRDDLGIEVVDIRVKRIDRPDQVRESIYNRMNTEREKEAQEERSTGRELSEGIEAEADRDRIVIEANAYRDAEIIRGDGDAQAAAIYAQAFNKDPEFYEFMRSLAAYRETFATSRDVMVIGPDSEFFKYLKSSKSAIEEANQ